ncbi:hypothetical protein PAXRUDRAFT_830473 [Paxillus rubicundulus Ve08.2h10]|uniref:Uncharacterized protein n=1 Tax=Paxillus rubicundulus Ve08.2h10 TaxID=930991 RepID=A0A0D0DKW9_9AGAM|nr:hypothetical protein PAXRUDRAFT_830473 [Paxillus rubicundulus Ve08.2h10]
MPLPRLRILTVLRCRTLPSLICSQTPSTSTFNITLDKRQRNKIDHFTARRTPSYTASPIPQFSRQLQS